MVMMMINLLKLLLVTVRRLKRNAGRFAEAGRKDVRRRCMVTHQIGAIRRRRSVDGDHEEMTS